MDVRAKMNVNEGNGGTGESLSFDVLDIRSGEVLSLGDSFIWNLRDEDRNLLWIDSVIDVGFRRNSLTVYKKSDSLGTAKLIRSHYEKKALTANLSVGVMQHNAFTQKVAYEFGFTVKSISDNQGGKVVYDRLILDIKDGTEKKRIVRAGSSQDYLNEVPAD